MITFKTKIISYLLIVSIIIPATLFTAPKKVNAAGFPVFDAINETLLGLISATLTDIAVNTTETVLIESGVSPGVAQKETVWDAIAYFAARTLIRTLSQSIVDWINSGFQGNPSFIQNPEKFLTDTADRAVGEFIFANPDLKFLCSPFQMNIKINLGLGYSPFKDKINCTLSGALQNTQGAVTEAYENFMSGDFINGGGWDSWLNITTQPQNNQLGAMLIAQAELDASVANKQLAKKDELSWNGGLLSMKNCVRTTTDADGKVTETKNFEGDSYYQSSAPGAKVGSAQTTATPSADANNPDIPEEMGGPVTGSGKRPKAETPVNSSKDVCNIVTPGTWITGTGNKVLGMDLDALGVADELNEIVGALANFVISQVMQKGMAAVKKEDLSPSNPSWQAGISNLRTQQSTDRDNAGSDSAYTPDYSSYSGEGEIYTDDASLNTDKEDLLARIGLDRESEQYYYDNYFSAYTNASTTETTFLRIINTCTLRLGMTPPLTPSIASTISGYIITADTVVNNMRDIKATSTPNINSSQQNLLNLQTISDAVDAAYTIEVVDEQTTALANLEMLLHTPDQRVEARDFASSTLSQIDALPNTTAILQACTP
jgi:hypothetical protein